MIIEDRWYQTEAVQAIFDYFDSGQAGNPIIALPTATGKSVVIARFIQRVLFNWPRQRFLMLTHIKHLIEQNAAELLGIWPLAPLGIYSAGLNQKDYAMPVVFGGVASVVKNIEAFGWRDLIIIDECHLLSPNEESMYQTIIAGLKKVNPYLKVIGLTATPYRMGNGLLTDDGLFTDIIYDLTDMASFNRLLSEGFLAPLIAQPTTLEIDISNVGMQGHDYAQGQLQAAVDKKDITYAAITEACQKGQNRRSWLLFSAGIEHADHCAEMLNSFGVSAASVHNKTKSKDRDERIKAHKAGQLRCLVGNNIFTTGYNHRPLDLIIDLQHTLSVPKHVQKYGRGTRTSVETHKENCLVLDFPRNTRRLGPINDPVIPRKKGKGTGEVPIKICPNCDTYNHITARFCCYCNFEFIFKVNIFKEAGTDEIIRGEMPVVEFFNVDQVIYAKHQKGNGSIKITYYCEGGGHRFNEWINFESIEPFVIHKAHELWRKRMQWGEYMPVTNDEALAYLSHARNPRTIRVWVNKKFPQVLSHDY